MSTEGADLAERALQRRKREDAAVAVPALGVLLLISPLLNVVAGLDSLFGVPAAYVYVFTVWAGLILLTWRLARRLSGSAERD